MGMREQLQSIVGRTFTKLGNAIQLVTYKYKISSSYNPDAAVGSQVSAGYTSISNVRASVGQLFEHTEETGSRKVKFLTRSFCIEFTSMVGVTPRTGDLVLIGADNWTVMKTHTDEAQASYVMDLRFP